MKVFVFGAGKVGVAFARGLRAAGEEVVLRAARRGLPARPIDADVVVLALRDRDLEPLARELADSGLLARRAVVVHNAGALSAEVLASLRPVCAGVAQMHPMISFASKTRVPRLAGGHCHVAGDPKAVARARTLARKLAMTPRTFPDLDTVGYHAAAGLVANGAVALAASARELLMKSGVPASTIPAMLGPLLRSVAENIESLGFPDALTGPVRRGDAKAIERQCAMVGDRSPHALGLLVACAKAQLPLAREIGDAAPEEFDRVERALHHALP